METTETLPVNEGAITYQPTELELLNLKVAAIAGWTDIKIWNPSALKKSYTGVNLAHPELGVHIPNYVESIDAIALVFQYHQLNWDASVAWNGRSYAKDYHFNKNYGAEAQNLALALCKLLLKINPDPIKKQEVAVIDDDGDIDEPTVIEATFG